MTQQVFMKQDRWPRMGAAGRRLVETSHDSAHEIPRLEARYAELIEAHEW
jgi:hypothetical protein